MKGLSFEVSRSGAENQRIPLREGLSIGRGPDNTIVLDEPAVNPVHAVLSTWAGQPMLECCGDVILMFLDGRPVRQVPVIPDVTFIIGSALFRCVAEEAPCEDAGDGPRRHRAPLPNRCPRCTADLAGLPDSARFCPRCGRRRSAQADTPPAPLARAIPWNTLTANLLPSPADSYSLILAGYAAAMTNLGHRYETGCGTPRNEDEAIRCYVKAARLGNKHARTRLEARGISLGH